MEYIADEVMESHSSEYLFFACYVTIEGLPVASCQIVEIRAASQAFVGSISKLKTSNIILAVTIIIPKKRL